MSTSHPPKLLIPRAQRQQFCLLFIFMTVLGWFVGQIVSIGLQIIIRPRVPPSDYWDWVKLLGDIVFAIIFATDQALVLNAYISGRLWMLATAVGWLCADAAALIGAGYIASIASRLHSSVPTQLAILIGSLSTFSHIMAGIFLGFCQWLVIRRYAKGAWLWIFLHCLSFLLISILPSLFSFVQNLFPEVNLSPLFYWSTQAVTSVVMAVIPTLALCNLKRNLSYSP